MPFDTFHSGIVYVDRVRYNDCTICICDEDAIIKRLNEIEEGFIIDSLNDTNDEDDGLK